MDTALVKIDVAKQALIEARSIEDVLEIRDRAMAAHVYAIAKNYREAADIAKEAQLRAERRAGEFLSDMPKSKGGATTLHGYNRLQDETGNNNVKLEDIGINKAQSSRWQSIASVPDELFEQHIADRQRNGKELTQAGLLQLAARQRVPEPTETPPFPEQRYRCIVIDPPWPMKKIEREERPNQGLELDYPTMTLDEIAALPISDLADENGCHLYLWVTQKYLPVGLEIVKGWGFKYQCLMTWNKNTGIVPYSWLYDTEHVIFARCGNLSLSRLGLRLSFNAPSIRGGHSTKPEVFFNERVIVASPEPRLEMFARKERDGFSVWGNEVSPLGS